MPAPSQKPEPLVLRGNFWWRLDVRENRAHITDCGDALQRGCTHVPVCGAFPPLGGYVARYRRKAKATCCPRCWDYAVRRQHHPVAGPLADVPRTSALRAARILGDAGAERVDTSIAPSPVVARTARRKRIDSYLFYGVGIAVMLLALSLILLF